MVAIKVGEHFADGDYSLLERHLRLLDSEITIIDGIIKEASDPETDGLCDAGEYFIGHGFVAIQRYLTATYSLTKLDKKALDLPPSLLPYESQTLARAIHDAANYWKHCEEWYGIILKSENPKLRKDTVETIDRLEKAQPLSDYYCSNLLATLTEGRELKLSSLLPAIADWRSNLFQSQVD